MSHLFRNTIVIAIIALAPSIALAENGAIRRPTGFAIDVDLAASTSLYSAYYDEYGMIAPSIITPQLGLGAERGIERRGGLAVAAGAQQDQAQAGADLGLVAAGLERAAVVGFRLGVAPFQVGDPAQAETPERRDAQADLTGDVAERVAAGVTVRGGIGQLAGADAVEDEDDGAVRSG